MTTDDERHMRQILAMVAATWTNFNQREQAQVYAMALADIDLDILEEAVKRLIKTRDFLPTPAEIRLSARYVRQDLLSYERQGLTDLLPPWYKPRVLMEGTDGD